MESNPFTLHIPSLITKDSVPESIRRTDHHPFRVKPLLPVLSVSKTHPYTLDQEKVEDKRTSCVFDFPVDVFLQGPVTSKFPSDTQSHLLVGPPTTRPSEVILVRLLRYETRTGPLPLTSVTS